MKKLASYQNKGMLIGCADQHIFIKVIFGGESNLARAHTALFPSPSSRFPHPAKLQDPALSIQPPHCPRSPPLSSTLQWGSHSTVLSKLLLSRSAVNSLLPNAEADCSGLCPIHSSPPSFLGNICFAWLPLSPALLALLLTLLAASPMSPFLVSPPLDNL